MQRTARSSRPQLVCVLADNSGSMRGPKAHAATEGIRELLLECQTRGPRGRDRSYFRFVMIRFGNEAELVVNCEPVRDIDPDAIHVAAVTVARADLVLSWNFRHIVNYDRIHKYNGVNALNGYPPIEIHSPLEMDDEEEGQEV